MEWLKKSDMVINKSKTVASYFSVKKLPKTKIIAPISVNGNPSKFFVYSVNHCWLQNRLAVRSYPQHKHICHHQLTHASCPMRAHTHTPKFHRQHCLDKFWPKPNETDPHLSHKIQPSREVLLGRGQLLKIHQ